MKAKSNTKFKLLCYFQRHSKSRSFFSVFLSVAFLQLSTGCTYYRVKSVPSQGQAETVKQIRSFNEADKYIILHRNNASLHLANAAVSEDNLELSGSLELLSKEHTATRIIKPKRSYQYKRKDSNPLNEVHIYLKEGVPLSLGATAIPFDQIDQIGIVNPDGTTSVVNAALTTIGAFALILVIVALTKSSCPFVYADSGNGLVFSGELYPGNIIKNAQQTDYLPLPLLQASDSELHLQITNELLEVQHTDLAQLMVVKHRKNTKALLDKYGKVVLFKDLKSPRRVIVDGRIDHSGPALAADGESYNFDTPILTKNSTRDVVFTFARPDNQKEAKLYLTAKNSLWLDYVFGKFNEQFGVYYDTFQESQLETTREEANSWAEKQNIPLTVSIKKKGEWQVVEQLSSVGPLSYRDLAIKLDLKDIEKEEVEVKIETGFIFWEVDYVGIDYSEELNFKTYLLNPQTAISDDGRDVAGLLSSEDGQYFTQEEVGDRVDIRYTSPEQHGDYSYSYFLKNRGYYTYVRDYQGIPDFSELRKFKNQNAFTRFSENEYQRLLRQLQMKKESYVVQ
ncbi:hypothetical protein [Muriicola soli]|uniref:Uncharacterized protein n=1 Tax=Muriicola soli TaxID=2507538 RepID=A0A411E9M4_9FLAO|nr:hypothetical protein [Muriicola soli]QBA64234.1 hypothetical protein EQY75_06665 [Muriicola soli]